MILSPNNNYKLQFVLRKAVCLNVYSCSHIQDLKLHHSTRGQQVVVRGSAPSLPHDPSIRLGCKISKKKDIKKLNVFTFNCLIFFTLNDSDFCCQIPVRMNLASEIWREYVGYEFDLDLPAVLPAPDLVSNDNYTHLVDDNQETCVEISSTSSNAFKVRNLKSKVNCLREILEILKQETKNVSFNIKSIFYSSKDKYFTRLGVCMFYTYR